MADGQTKKKRVLIVGAGAAGQSTSQGASSLGDVVADCHCSACRVSARIRASEAVFTDASLDYFLPLTGPIGMSCADSLSNHPDRFDVTLIEAQNYCGGQAFSIPIDEKKYGSSWMNQGVQG